jgi:hypothetical protein
MAQELTTEQIMTIVDEVIAEMRERLHRILQAADKDQQ